MKVLPQSLDKLKDVIQEELLRRGFTAKIINLRLKASGTSCFSTVDSDPVLFQSIEISTFSSSSEEKDDLIHFFMTINSSKLKLQDESKIRKD